MEEKLNSLNSMQKKAVINSEGPLLILAGAGSGKTRVLTHKIAYLIENGVRAFNILAITFTNKAAKEMKERVCALSSEGSMVLVSTFHSLCVRILRRDIEAIGYNKNFTIYDADDSERVIKEIIKDFKIDEKKISAKYIASKISSQKDKLISPEEFEQKNYTDFREKTAIEVYKEYQKRLFNNQALDFDDLIYKTVELFTKCEDILENYRERFRYILVDEYQDTSKAQYELVKLLAQKYRNICVVGDDDQSIYGWRGADISNILNFEKDFEEAKTIKLEQNYRSSKKILNTANFVIKNNFGRKEKSLWTENIDGEDINYITLENDKEESKFIANEIINKRKEGYKLKDMAILYRKNALSRVLEEQLMFLSIPYKIYGGLNFYSRKEIKDILAYLRILLNPKDSVSIRRIINVPKRNIGDVTIGKIIDYSNEENISFYTAMKNVDKIEGLGKKQQEIYKFLDIIEELREDMLNMSVSNLIKSVLHKTGYLEDLEKQAKKEAEARIENLREFISKAVEFENVEDEREKNLINFLEDIALVAEAEERDEEQDFVSLMTVHTSKGLEFPIVFLAGFEEGIFPISSSFMGTSPEELEEERRLLYVAITRAKELLYITNANTRLQNGEFKRMFPSSFFREMPKEYINNIQPKKAQNIRLSNNVSSTNSSVGKYRPKPAYKPDVSSYLKKQMPISKNASIDFEVGDYVRHFKFGEGKVLSISPSGADYEVDVEFGNGTVKKLMANLSKLKKI